MDDINFGVDHVDAGEPIRASTFNAILDALHAVVGRVNDGQTVSAMVRVVSAVDSRLVRVTAMAPARGLAFEAVPVASEGEGPTHIVSGLEPGEYRFTASVPGGEPVPVQREITGAENEEMVVIELQAPPQVPPVFGLSLGDAAALLEGRGVTLVRVLDIFGRDLPPADLADRANTSRVLLQQPDPGTFDDEAQLVVSASVEVQPTVVVPDLTGLSEAEAERVLAQVGLKVGTVRVRRR
ncbi:MAG: PASTA domain-containing protein [Acidobacteriota bacterium]